MIIMPNGLALTHRCSSQARLTSGTSQARNRCAYRSCSLTCHSAPDSCAKAKVSPTVSSGPRGARGGRYPAGAELGQSPWSARRRLAQLQRQPSAGKARRRG